MPIATSTSTATTTAARPQVLYEAPHGTLRLRGHHEAPGTQAFPELDTQGVSNRRDSFASLALLIYAIRDDHGIWFGLEDPHTQTSLD